MPVYTGPLSYHPSFEYVEIINQLFEKRRVNLCFSIRAPNIYQILMKKGLDLNSNASHRFWYQYSTERKRFERFELFFIEFNKFGDVKLLYKPEDDSKSITVALRQWNLSKLQKLQRKFGGQCDERTASKKPSIDLCESKELKIFYSEYYYQQQWPSTSNKRKFPGLGVDLNEEEQTKYEKKIIQ